MPYVEESEITLDIDSIMIVHYITQSLTQLINRSLTEGFCPDELKLAKVIPIYKAGSSMELSNYRPISILNFFTKICEKIVYNHIIQFLDKNVY